MTIALLKKLAVRSVPLVSEGAKGYLLRLATVNGVDLNGLGIERQLTLKNLSCLLGRDDRAIWEKHPSSEFWFEQKSRALIHWNWRNRKFCPACLSMDSGWRLDWELRHLTTCSIHQINLVDVCPQCTKEISWQTQELTKCKCGFDLRLATAARCSDEDRMLAQACRATLGLGEMPENLSMLRQLTSNDLFQVIRYLGNLELEYKQITRADNRCLKLLSPVFTNAAKMLAGWPETYHSCLNKIRDGAMPSVTSMQMATIFGKAYTGLYLGLKKESMRFIHTEFEQYLQKNWQWSLSKRNTRLAQEIRDTGVWLPVAQAAKRLQVRSQKLSALVEQGEMAGKIFASKSGRTHLVVHVSDVDTIKNAMTDFITLSEVREILGISDKRIFELMDEKIIKLCKKTTNNSHGQWRFSKSEITELLDHGKSSSEVESGEISDPVYIHALLQSGLRGATAFSSLMKAIINGSIQVTVQAGNLQGISGWIISKKLYEQWLELQVSDGEYRYTLQKVAALLRTKEQVAYSLVKNGLLKADPVERNGRRLQIVAASEICNFKNRYVFNSQLAEQLKISPRKLLRIFSALGVKPYFDVGKNLMRQAFFEKTENFKNCLAQIVPDY